MKNPLRKRYVRDLKKNMGRYLAIFIMLMVTIGFMSGFLAVSDGVQIAFQENREECKLEDGLFSSYQRISPEILKDIETLGIQVYENFYLDEELEQDALLRIYKNREYTNLVTVMEGELPKEQDEIAVERLYAENHQIKLGDTLTVEGNIMKITGFISVPDYSSLFEKNSDLMMDSFHFGLGIVTEESFHRYDPNKLIYNYSYYFNNRELTGKEQRDLSKLILDRLVEKQVLLTLFCTAENNSSISFLEDDLGSDVPLMKVLLNIIIVIMAFVYAIVISSTIDAEAAIIGTLLASGYQKGELIRHYLGLPLIVTLFSALVGNILGYALMPGFFKGMFYDSYSLPPMEINLNIEAFVLTTIVPIGIMLVINLLTLIRKLSISPLNFLRRDLRKRKQRRALKLPKISFFSRFRLRIMIQNCSNYLTLAIGIYFASVILLFGLCLNPLVHHYVESMKEVPISNYQYILKTEAEAENEPDSSSEKFTFTSMETYYELGKKDIEVSFYGLTKNSKYVTELSNVDFSKGVYCSDGLMKKLKKTVGEKIVFKNPYTEKEYELEIIGIYHYPAGLAVFMNQKQLNLMLDYEESHFNGYFSKERLNFKNESILGMVITPEDMIKLGDQMTSSFSQMAPMCLGISVIIFLVLMYLLTKMVIEKNALYISLMKVFGYEETEIRKLYLTSTTVVVMISLIVSIPLVYITMQFCFEAVLAKVSGYIPIYIPRYSYGEILLIGFGTYLIINFFHKKKVDHITMAEALKSGE